MLGITSYLNLREHHPFWPSPTKIVVPSTVVDRGDVVGIFVIRRDGVKSPSLRDIMIARHLEATQDSALIPFLILLINIDSNQCSWVYEMHYSCFGVQRDSPKYASSFKYVDSTLLYLHRNLLIDDRCSLRTLLSLDLKIPSLSADSAADYKSSPCLNSDATILNYMGEESAAMMSGVAATTVHNSVDTELLAVRLIDEIKVQSFFEFLLQRELGF